MRIPRSASRTPLSEADMEANPCSTDREASTSAHMLLHSGHVSCSTVIIRHMVGGEVGVPSSGSIWDVPSGLIPSESSKAEPSKGAP